MTYQEIKDAILVLLDIDLSSTGDIATQVEVHMKRIMDEIAAECKPRELLAQATDAAVVSTYTSIPLFSSTPGFGITQSTYMKPAFLFVDDDTSDTEEPPLWEFVPFPVWLRLRRPESDRRGYYSWTIDEQNEVILKTWPGTGETWSAQLYYYKQPAAIVLTNSPEIANEHHFAIVLGTTVCFPNMFQTDERKALLIKYQRDYEEELKKIKLAGEIAIKDHVFALHMSSPTSGATRGVNWGNYHTS